MLYADTRFLKISTRKGEWLIERGILFKKYGKTHAGFNLSKSCVLACFDS